MSINSLSFLPSYFLIIPAIVRLPPPSNDICLSGRTPATLPISPPALLLCSFQLVYSLKRGWCTQGGEGRDNDGVVHRGEGGDMMMMMMMMMERGDMMTTIMMERGVMVT